MANKQDPCLARTVMKLAATDHLPQATTSWVDMMEAEYPDMPPLFEGLLTQDKGELGYEDAKDDAESDLLDLDIDEEEEEHKSLFPAQQPRPPGMNESASAQSAARQV